MKIPILLLTVFSIALTGCLVASASYVPTQIDAPQSPYAENSCGACSNSGICTGDNCGLSPSYSGGNYITNCPDGSCDNNCQNGNCGNNCQNGNCDNNCQNGNCGNDCQNGNCGNDCQNGNSVTPFPYPNDESITPSAYPNGDSGTTIQPDYNPQYPNGDSGTTNEPLNETSSNGITTYKLCSDGECHTGADGSVITITNYDNAKDPTYDQLLTFLKEDKTDEHRYIMNQFICTEFAKNVHDNAEKNGIKCAFIGCDFKEGGIGHAFNMFNTTDRGIVYMDCTGTPQGSTYEDKILDCAVGKPLTSHYLFKDGSTENAMGTVGKLYTYW
jgi:hypothetical protein